MGLLERDLNEIVCFSRGEGWVWLGVGHDVSVGTRPQ